MQITRATAISNRTADCTYRFMVLPFSLPRFVGSGFFFLNWFFFTRTHQRQNTGAESNHAAANTIVPLDENNAAKSGPRPRSVSPSVATANANEKGMNAYAAHKPTIAFMDEREAHRQDVTDSRTMAKSEGHALLRITEACNIESLEDEDERTAGMVHHNMEASNVAHQAPASVEIAATNGAIALDASLAAECAGANTAPPRCLPARTHTKDK